jgi:U3 small nucleolar RNA-associated protein 3
MAKGGRGGQARGGTRTASNNKRPAQRKYDTADGAISDDEVDAFHNSRDRVALRGFESKQREKSLLDQDDEELMELDMSDEDSEEELQMVPVPRSKYDESDSENNGADDDEKLTSAWGRKKSIFYSADTVDAGDSAEDADAMAEEEQEAVRLQNKMLAGAREDDFDDLAMMPIKPTKGKKKNAEGNMLDGMNKDLDSIAVNIEYTLCFH